MAHPVIEVAMIVRNGAGGLARALGSVLPVVDRIVIGDTGSTDNSIAIAHNFNAEILHVPWEGDFSKARNAVLSICRGDWILVLDPDEMLDPDGASRLRDLTGQSQIDAWESWEWNYVGKLTSRSGGLVAEVNPVVIEESRPYPAFTRHRTTQLFRRRPDVYYEYPVHETVSHRLRTLGLNVAQAPFVIHHFGFVEDSKEEREEKLEIYHRMGIEKVQAYPNDAWAHYELGLSYLEHRRDAGQAYTCFARAAELDPGLKEAWLYAGISLTRLGRYNDALACLNRIERDGSNSALLLEARGDVCFHAGDFSHAAYQYRQIGQDAELTPFVACKLGVCEVGLGNTAGGLTRIEAAIAREAEVGELYEIWAAATLLAGDAETAAQIATRRLKIGTPPVDSFVVAAGYNGRLARWDRALTILAEGLRIYPANSVLERESTVALERVGGFTLPS